MSSNDNWKEDQISLFELLVTFWRSKKVIALFVCVALIISLFVTAFVMTPQYLATTTLAINPHNTSPAPISDRVTIADPFDSIVSLSQEDIIFIIETEKIIQKTIDRLGLDMSVSELSNAMTISKVPSTSYVEVSIRHFDPDVAVNIVNTLVLVFHEEMIDYHYQSYSRAQNILGSQIEELSGVVQNAKQDFLVYEGMDIEELQVELTALKSQLRSDKDRLISIEMQSGIERAYVELLSESGLIDSMMLDEPFDIVTNPNAPLSSQINNFSVSIRSDRLSDVMIRSDYIETLLRLQRFEYEQELLKERIHESEMQIENIQQYLLDNEDDFFSMKNDIEMGQAMMRAYQQRSTELSAFRRAGTFESIVSVISPSTMAPRTGPNWLLNVSISLVLGLFLGMFAVLTQQRLIEEGIIKPDNKKKK